MTQILHIVGRQGSGRTTFAVALARFHRTSHCVLVDELGGIARFDPKQGFFLDQTEDLLDVIPTDVQLVFREHTPEKFAGAQPGEWVMSIDQAREGVPNPLSGAAAMAGVMQTLGRLDHLLQSLIQISVQVDRVTAVGIGEGSGSCVVAGVVAQEDALAGAFQAQLTGVAQGAAIAANTWRLDNFHAIHDLKHKGVGSDFDRAVLALLDQGSLQLSKFLSGFAELVNQHRTGGLLLDGCMLRLDDLFVQFGGRLNGLRPVAGFDGGLEKADEAREAADRGGDFTAHRAPL